MIGRLYVNELTPNDVILELSASPGQIASTEHHYGFAYGKTLEHLGIERNDFDLRSMVLTGDLEAVQANAGNLNRHIGLIARYGADLDKGWGGGRFTRDHIGRTLGRICQTSLPECRTFTEVAVAVTRPFADAANDANEAFDVIYNHAPWWLEGNGALARHAIIEKFKNQQITRR